MKNILVVDDQEQILDLTELILTSSGYSCTVANGGKHALELIYDENNKYDLILMDLAMPEVSGMDVLKRLKEDGMLAKNNVVFFSASSLPPAEMENLRKFGALDAMNKPFSKAELLSFVKKHAK